VVAAVILPLVLAGCAASSVYKQGVKSAQRDSWDEAVLAFAKASAMKPDSSRYKISLEKAKQKASIVHFDKARKYLAADQLELAIGELQQTTVLDPTNEHASIELEKALLEWQKRRTNAEKTDLEIAKEKAARELGAPKLNPASNIPIILKFKETERGKIYEALSKASGINFLYDTRLDLKKPVTVDLTNVTFESAMNTLMLMNKHFFKVIDENTILIAEDTQQKRREIEDEVIKTFYLSNADVKDVQTLLRTLLDARKIVQNTQLNAITIRDTPARVAIAEKIVESNDKAKAELLIDVELMEISRTVSKTLGINLSSQRYSVKFTGGDTLPLNNLGLLKQVGNYAVGPIPSVTLDFLKSDSGTRTIAKPQLRVTEGEKANLHIGDSVPIPTTTFNTSGTVGTNVVPITSFTYQEVGIVIEIEPRVHHNNEVSLNLNVEVSQLGEQVSTGQGQTAPAINTRQIATVIRLKDGESNLLAGLIRDDGSEGRSGFPGLTDVPFIRRLFTSQTSTHRETDLILTLTPHIIRIPDIRDEDLVPLFIGTRDNPQLRGEASSVFGPNPFGPKVDDAGEEGASSAPGQTPAASEQAPAQESPAEKAPPATAPEAAPAAAPPPGQGVEGQEPVLLEEPAEDEGEDEEYDDEGAAEEETGKSAQELMPSRTPKFTEDAVTGRRRLVEPQTDNKPSAPEVQPPANNASLALAPARLTVAGGGGFAFNLMMTRAVNVQKLSVTLKYDPAIAEFDRALEGVLMRADGAATSFSASKTGPGTVQIDIQRVNAAAGAAGNGSAAAIRFKPVGAGRTMIEVASASAQDSLGRAIALQTTGADVTVTQ